MIGLPFPNAQTPEWKAKLRHVGRVAYTSLDETPPQAISLSQRQALAKATEREFYENACMRAVNQSIGRAIRHREDYATIVLIDKRYTGQRIQDKLPGWIKTGLVCVDVSKGDGRFGDFMKGCGAFFRGRKV